MPIAKSALTGTLLGAFFCATPMPSRAPAAPPQAGRPALLVFITVDQMRRDYLERFYPQFSGGLKRLVDGGAFFTNGHQDHAITETAPGHASLLSGRFPRSTGIARNLAGVNDSSWKLVSGLGLGAAPFRFQGSTLVDWLTTSDARSRALSVSYKDRGAILPIGRSQQEVYWYSIPGLFTTSIWYRKALPEWISAFNAREFPRYAGRVWNLLLPASAYPEPDSVPVESGGRNFLFPYTLSSSPDTAARQLPNFPFMDEITAAFALEGVQQLGLGRGPQTDVLAVSFSATDIIGHRTGPDSRETHDQILRLDRTIGAFIDSLYRLRDSTRIIIALTGDHGVAPYPELNTGGFTPAPSRVRVLPAIDAAEAVIIRAKGNVAAVDFESGSLVIDPGAVKVGKDVVQEATDSFIAVGRRIPGVLRADRLADLAKADTVNDRIARRWIHMFAAGQPVQAVITISPGSYWSSTFTGAMHGSPHDYDSNVPIIFYGTPFKPGRYSEFVRTVDMAPTLAQVLGVRPSEKLDGRALTAVIK